MYKRSQTLFKRSLLAASIVSLSACSTAPKAPDMGAIGSSIAKAGKATAEAGRKTWNTTAYLLGFSDSRDGKAEGASPTDEQLLVVENNTAQALPLALTPSLAMEELPASDPTDGPALVEAATASSADAANSADLIAADSADIDQTPAQITEQVAEDLVHEVSARETLWDIAKATTGDATNWHVLADVNNLAQNAAVFPGQQLIIPADMVKQDYDAPMSSPDSIAVIENTLGENAALTTSAAADEEPVDVSIAATPFDLNDSETLWDFAKRTTGDATNWQAIAAHNNFSEKQAVTVRPGQTIYVPQELVQDGLGANISNETAPIAQTATVAQTPEAADALAENVAQTTESATTLITDTEAALAESAAGMDIASDVPEIAAAALPSSTDGTTDVNGALAADDNQDIRIVEATYKSDDTLNPVVADEPSVEVVDNANVPAQIMVSGTYYPKAIYNDADFSASLLMRVSPGTTLEVSRAMGTWFEVQTDKGIGYVHQRDIE